MAPNESDAPASGRRASIARRTLVGFRADAISAVSMLVASIIVARGLGPADRGVFFLVFLGATMAALLADLGLSATSIVFGANREIAARQLHAVAVLLSVGAAALAAALLLPFEGFWTGSVLQGLDTTLLALLAVGILPVLYAQVVGALLTGMGHVPEVAALRIGQAILYPLLVTGPALAGDPRWAVVAWLATATAYALGLAWHAVRLAGGPRLPPREVFTRILNFGGRGYVGSLAQQGFLRVDVLFLSAHSGPAIVGIYSLASIFAEKMGLIGHALYGASAEAVGQGGPGAARLIAVTLRLMLTLLVPLAILLGALAFGLFPLVFGEGFRSAALPFILLLPGTTALACWSLVGLFLVSALRRPGTTTLIQAGGLVVSLPLYYVAIREAEMAGAAIVSSAAYLAVLGAGVAVMLRSTELKLGDLLPGRAEPVRLVGFVRAALSRQAGV
jgi:O-antigen/teichoic acid export membrane protein